MNSVFILVGCLLWSAHSGGQQLIGGEIEASRDDFDLLQGLDKGLMVVNARTGEEEKFVFVPDSIHATSQVVQGTRYRIQVIIAKSVCRNDEAHKFDRIDKCPVKPQVPGDKNRNCLCQFVIWSRPWLTGNESIIVQSANCTPVISTSQPILTGGALNSTDILKHPHLLQGLDIALMDYNNEGIDGTGLVPANKYVYLPQTLNVTIQEVEGKVFRAHVHIAPSICPNDDEHTYLRVDECSVQDINSLDIRRLIRKCEFEIWSRPWLPIPNALTVKKLSCVPVPVSSPQEPGRIHSVIGLKI